MVAGDGIVDVDDLSILVCLGSVIALKSIQQSFFGPLNMPSSVQKKKTYAGNATFPASFKGQGCGSVTISKAQGKPLATTLTLNTDDVFIRGDRGLTPHNVFITDRYQ